MRHASSSFEIICGLVALVVLSTGCRAAPGAQEATMGMTVTSTAFSAGGTIPVRTTGQGANVSPDLAWSDVPDGTASFVLICDDPDAPSGTWVHWTMWNIPASARGLPAAVPTADTLPDGAVQGITSFGEHGYGGPMPPPGNAHRYYFRVYALNTTLSLPSSAHRAELDQAMKGHVLAQGQLMGTYQRR